MASTDSLGLIRGDLARAALAEGIVIPAHPLAIDPAQQLDERRQRGLSRYYIAAGAGGLAVGVHTTQFKIHDPKVGFLKPVLALAAEEMDRANAHRAVPLVRIAGICGDTHQAVHEAELARDLGYDFGLVSFVSSGEATIKGMLDHYRTVAEVLGVFGFYLQPKVGGIDLPLEFWRGVCEIENVVAIKVAAFDRYRTLNVVRAVAESGRADIALYTGNDDNIVLDLLSPYTFAVNGKRVERHFVGGLLGQWAVWTQKAVELHRQCREVTASAQPVSSSLLRRAIELTDANSAIFDAAHDFRGCVAGIHEVLRRQGLLDGANFIEPHALSPGQAEEIGRVSTAYPHLIDDSFVAQHRDDWLSG